MSPFFGTRISELCNFVWPLAIVSYNLLDGVLMLSVTWSSVIGCHHLSSKSICRFPVIHWRGVRCVSDPLYIHFVVDFGCNDNDGVWSDLQYLT